MVEYREFLCEWFTSLGRVWPNANGYQPLPHTEIAAWAANQNMTFVESDAEWLFKMSEAYADELSKSHNKDSPAPYTKPQD